MEANQQTKRVAFCCPHHGALKGTPEYFSANFGSKRLVDISAMYCAACGKYYTPFANLLAFKQLRFKGREVAVSQGRVERSIPREVVRVPRFLDISEKGIQPSRNTAKKGQTTQHNTTQKASARNKSGISANMRNTQKQNNETVQNKATSRKAPSEIGLNAQIYLSNTYSAANNICPLCRSVLSRENVNIPVIETTGDFFRYYTESVRFCHKCRKAFISKETITSILTKVNSTSSNPKTLKIENATIHRDNSSQKYLFNPTLDNSYAIFFPGQDYERRRESTSDEMELNPQSFLGEMGYSTSKGINVRRHILTEAIKTYGKRKVCDHLAFLISMRKAQVNGAVKYANALKIWQDDLNYISAKDPDIVL